MEQMIEINKFLNDSGKIIQLPQKKSTKTAVLSYLAEKFKADHDYTEKEVNSVCESWSTFGDFFLLRRELIDSGLLCREPDGSRYWKRELKKLNTAFHRIDFEKWDRKPYFYYFTKLLPTGYSISTELDVTTT